MTVGARGQVASCDGERLGDAWAGVSDGGDAERLDGGRDQSGDGGGSLAAGGVTLPPFGRH